MICYPFGKKGPELIAYSLPFSLSMHSWIAERIDLKTCVKHEHTV